MNQEPLGKFERIEGESAGDGLTWYDIRQINMEGRGWTEVEEPFDRLPSRAKTMVNESVWGFSKHSAGLYVRFVSNTVGISARWTVKYDILARADMPATGVSGLDLYVKHDGFWRWLGVGGKQINSRVNQSSLVAKTDMLPGTREFMLYENLTLNTPCGSMGMKGFPFVVCGVKSKA